MPDEIWLYSLPITAAMPEELRHVLQALHALWAVRHELLLAWLEALRTGRDGTLEAARRDAALALYAEVCGWASLMVRAWSGSRGGYAA